MGMGVYVSTIYRLGDIFTRKFRSESDPKRLPRRSQAFSSGYNNTLRSLLAAIKMANYLSHPALVEQRANGLAIGFDGVLVVEV